MLRILADILRHDKWTLTEQIKMGPIIIGALKCVDDVYLSLRTCFMPPKTLELTHANQPNLWSTLRLHTLSL